MVDAPENEEASRSSRPPARSKSGLWRWGKNLLTIVFLALVGWLLISHAREVDWSEVKQALDSYTWVHIAAGVLLALSTYIAYSGYDVLARYMIGHRIPVPTTMTIAYICCAFTLNLGALIGSLGFRYRLYSQYGVSKGNIARIVGILITTNWLGYIALAGVVFVSGAVVVPNSWEIGALGLRILGGVFLALVVSYLLLSLFSPKRTLEIRGQTITLPSIKIAGFQLVLSCSHWALMAAVIYSFLYTEIGYFPLLGVLLISAIAGIIAHVPGALGVLEAVFIALLGSEINPAVLVAALIAYRVVFYLLPLVIAGAAYLVIEMVPRKSEPAEA
ncbi:lysylphosphatidylglycerol synthase transmembrane domain-containing protein [Marinimicrobium sp. C2-29]|uniref:lysylphosphatidylglycerol synthase transmembrane domain-containing protein n=1 Tax=Marinimicrobium sp. C2-29 TaxID=3139825 RepID=UPI0031391154